MDQVSLATAVTPLIEIGVFLSIRPQANGLDADGGSTVKGLAIQCFARGIELQGTSNLVVSSYLGTDVEGTTQRWATRRRCFHQWEDRAIRSGACRLVTAM